MKSLWYTDHKNYRKRKLIKGGIRTFTSDKILMYESVLPPLLRLFHIKNISPSGWVTFNKSVEMDTHNKTIYDYEYTINYKNLKPLNDKEEMVPLKIASMDIECDSSHGDVPLPKKTYKKLLKEIIDYWIMERKAIMKFTLHEKKELFIDIVLTSFGYRNIDNISKVYPKYDKWTEQKITLKMKEILEIPIGNKWTGLLKMLMLEHLLKV